MYPGMAKTARDEGFKEVADWFETLAKAEKSHAGRFDKMLKTIATFSTGPGLAEHGARRRAPRGHGTEETRRCDR